jgi:hypothetical protein
MYNMHDGMGFQSLGMSETITHDLLLAILRTLFVQKKRSFNLNGSGQLKRVLIGWYSFDLTLMDRQNSMTNTTAGHGTRPTATAHGITPFRDEGFGLDSLWAGLCLKKVRLHSRQ